MCLSLRLLGPPEVTLDGDPVAGFVSDKARALLFFLAVEADRAHRRETLAGLLWPGYPERSARTNLSNALSNLRTVLSDRTRTSPYLLVSRQTIQFDAHSDYRLDVQTFDARFEDQQWEDVAALSTGQFLEGFSLPDSPAFEQWALVVCERLQRQVGDALEALAAAYESHGDYARARATARHQLELEPWRESAHRTLIRCLALDGERAAALTQYETCVRTLREELDVGPDPATASLAQQIRKGTLGQASRRQGPASTPRLQVPSRLPQPQPTTSAPAPTTSAEMAFTAGERRLATVVHVEVTAAEALLDELGPEAWTATMDGVLGDLEAAAHRFGGEIYERRQDGLTVLFGVPVAHEDDAERAVLAALEMQGTADRGAGDRRLGQGRGPELGLCIGVDTGEMLVTYSGGQRKAIGRVLTLARRASVAAPRGKIQVGENTYRLARSLFEWEAGEEQRRPLARRGQRGKGRGIEGLSAPLIGRDEELAALHTAVDDLQRGIGGIITVVGEAGIGKSRLVAELRNSVLSVDTRSTNPNSAADLRSDLRWNEGRCLSYGGSIAYLLWLDLLRSVLNVTPDSPPLTVRDTLRALVQALCPECFDAVYPFLCKLMSLPLEDEYSALRTLQGESLRAEVFWAMQTLIESAARQQPWVIVCEDLHWADATSLALLERVLALTDRIPLLVLCVFRPERDHGCWQLKETAARLYHHRHTDLWLDALSADESRVLVGHLLRIEDLSAALRAKILDHAEGNPFYVEEIIRTLIDPAAKGGAAIVFDEHSGHWRATRQIADIPIPDTLHGVLMARIDGLQEETRRVLRLASVIGRVFFYRVLAAIAAPMMGAREEQQLGTRLLTLQRQQLIRERARLPEPEYIFKHELTREAAYNGLLKRERIVYHRQVAEALERLFPEQIDERAALLAHHWERAEKPTKAVEYLLRAGEQARLAYANEEAADHYQRALVLMDDPISGVSREKERLTALSGLGKVCLCSGRIADADGPLREAIALGKAVRLAPSELIRIYWWLGEVLYWQGRPDEGVILAEEGLALLAEDTGALEAALMNHTLASAYGGKGDQVRARQHMLRSMQAVQGLPYVEELRPVYTNACFLVHMPDRNVRETERWLLDYADRSRKHHDLRALGEVWQQKGNLSYAQGKLVQATTEYEQALAHYRRIGDARLAAFAVFHLSRAHLSLGALPKAEAHARRLLEMSEMLGPYAHRIGAQRYAGIVLLSRGNFEEAIRALQGAVELALKRDDGRRAGLVSRHLARVYLALGRHQQALKELQTPDILAAPGSDLTIIKILGMLEQASETHADFDILCNQFREQNAQVLTSRYPRFVGWRLELADVEMDLGVQKYYPGMGHDLPLQSPDWIWLDPYGDCSYTANGGLDIHAANGRDMWHINWSAPQMVQEVSGDFVAQTLCIPAMDDRPAIGGLLLWKDEKNYLRLDRGAFGECEIAFVGCLDNEDVAIGRGWLREASDRIYLRLERVSERVNAFCSADGERWFTVGHVTFPVQDPVQIGMHAIGNIDRTIYRGAYPEGTAIRFESFQLWQT